MKSVFEKIHNNQQLTRDDIRSLLSLESKEDLQKLFETAYEIKKRYVGTKAYFRGIVEFSNICTKDCYYCGIRKSNRNVKRFTIPEEDIIKSAVWAYKAGYGSAVFQSGERSDPEFVDMVERVLLAVKEQTNGKLGITLSLGEQAYKTYERWRKAGAHRYLLRIESSNSDLYKKLHPEDHSHAKRIECLKSLRKADYQVGTGVMIGLPFQTIDHLADDILFFKKIDIDMIGMGPFIFHKETPLFQHSKKWYKTDKELLTMGLKMIAATRIFLKDVNIASTTALQALKNDGRELGLKAGANVIMPNTTDTKYRESYKLYENKPCTDENASQSRGSLEKSIESIGETIGFNEWGDSPHCFTRKKF